MGIRAGGVGGLGFVDLRRKTISMGEPQSIWVIPFTRETKMDCWVTSILSQHSEGYIKWY